MPNRDFFRLKFDMPRMSADSSEAEVMLYGDIISDMPEDWKWSKEDKSAADFDKAIKSVREAGATKLLLRINSPGGIVSEAVAMRGIIVAAGFENVTIRIEGLCASAATLIASIPGATVEIMPGSEYMIHNPWTWEIGNAEQLEHAAAHLRSEEATARIMYAKKTGQEDEQIRAWMDAETWFTAEEAVKYGFCDKLLEEDAGSAKVAACVTSRAMGVMKAMYRNVPEGIGVDGDALPQSLARQLPPGGSLSGNIINVSNTGSLSANALKPCEARLEQRRANPSDSGTGRSRLQGSRDCFPVAENKNSKGERDEMDITTLTMEELRGGNPALYESIMQAGASEERQRIQDIDDLTPAGYEQMAVEAKANGTSAMDYHKAIIKAQREKGQQFLAQRAQETKAAAEVRGGASEDSAGVAQEIDAYAKEMADYAKTARASAEGMF